MENNINNFETRQEPAIMTALRILSVIFIIAFFAMSGYLFMSSKNKDLMAKEEYIGMEEGFIISYPKDWLIEKNDELSLKNKNMEAISFNNPVGDIESKFMGPARMMVYFNYADSPVSLDMYKNAIKSDMMHIFDNFAVLKEEKVSINNLEGYLIWASDSGQKMDNFSGEKPSYKSILFVTTEEKSNREFFIWATSFESSWPKYETLFENCIKSFKIPH